LLLGTDKGIVSYQSDAAAAGKVKYTDAEGNLTFSGDEIKGYKTVDMDGYLGVWVPVGAPDNQDLRVKASNEKQAKTYSATEALDSQVMYEGFSNFQAFVENDSQYTNKLIAENAELFKSWGITSFEMAPQYVSADDRTFLDSVIQNGYAFADRYDLAMSKNNKYGSKDDLRDALKALHKQGIQVIADWVPDQIYQLPGKEVVTATRTDGAGRKIADAIIDHSLYVANTKSSGKDYQAKYGGEFLAELKAKYPEMFKVNMISTGKPIDDSVKLKQWKAEYFNGTNVLERGVGYVLSDEATGKYFTVTKDGNFIPLQLTGNEKVVTGFSNDGKGIAAVSSDPTVTLTVGASTDQNKPVKVAVDVEFYDGNGNKFDLTQYNAIVALNSLNHWTGASYVDSGDKPRALTVEAKDKNGNTVRGTWNPYADGSSMSIENNAVVVKNGTADFGTADVTISAENPIKIVAQKATWNGSEFTVSEETIIDATSVNASGAGNGHSIGTDEFTFDGK
ncbi:MAG: hypothetical protein KH407_08680, partial [Streptococcus sp.]|nr:hypothetical protein [Streptococcus sp.]